MENRKVLVLGSKGMLGQELLRAFRKAEDTVTGWDIEDIDVTDAAESSAMIQRLSPDVILNAVAYNGVDACEENESEFEKAWRLNAEVPGELATAAKGVGATFVHYSTDYVFDGEEMGGYDESMIPDPISKYGESKLGGERAVERIGGDFRIIRLSKLFGRPAESSNGKRSFFVKMRDTAVGKEFVTAVDDELGCFTYAPDLAEATLALLDDGAPIGVYHLVNEGSATWFGALGEYFRIAGIPMEVRPVTGSEFPRSAKRPKCSVLRNTKRPKLRDFREALSDFNGS